MSDHATNIIQLLPEELRSVVFSFCHSSDVLSTCLTSRAMHHVCVRLQADSHSRTITNLQISSLYRVVDLSTHNAGHWIKHASIVNVDVPADHPQANGMLRGDIGMLRRQKELLQLLAEHPEIGTQTRVLRWTMFRDPSHAEHDALSAFNYGTLDLWRAFTSFTRLTEIDLAFLTVMRERERPPPLFRFVTSICLSGVVSHAVVSSILTSVDPAKLRYLKLNNLQTFKEPRSVHDSLTVQEIQQHRLERSGAAQGWLVNFTGRCACLRSLHLLTTAVFVDESSPDVHQTWHVQVGDEHRRYAELAAFIQSVKPTLEEFVFEHGPDIDYFNNYLGKHTDRAFGGPSHDNPLPLDSYFDTHILPVVASGPWPKLRRITIKGIGHWKPLDPWRQQATPEEIRYLHRKTREFHGRAEMIWDAVGAGERSIEFAVEAEASKPFYRFQNDKSRSMMGNGSLT